MATSRTAWAIEDHHRALDQLRMLADDPASPETGDGQSLLQAFTQ